jgi:A/G-specific adenine glycosylase
MISALGAEQIEVVRRRVLDAAAWRDLPWRRTRDPWAVLVSELMLQQTQVARVLPRYTAFLERFPTVRDCAVARPGDVVSAWAGLGYNRRAVQLHRCASAVCERHGGAIPDQLHALLALPGVGPYTARAVLAFAFEHDVAVLDTNVARVIARVAGRPFTPADAQACADSLVPAGAGWRWNQSMLDVGAQVCTKRAPRCESCPLDAVCAWRGEGCDPAIRSAGVSGSQSTFAGSDRQGRGRLVAALRHGPVDVAAAAAAMGWPDDAERAARVVATLVTDHLVARRDDRFELP